MPYFPFSFSRWSINNIDNFQRTWIIMQWQLCLLKHVRNSPRCVVIFFRKQIVSRSDLCIICKLLIESVVVLLPLPSASQASKNSPWHKNKNCLWTQNFGTIEGTLVFLGKTNFQSRRLLEMHIHESSGVWIYPFMI